MVARRAFCIRTNVNLFDFKDTSHLTDISKYRQPTRTTTMLIYERALTINQTFFISLAQQTNVTGGLGLLFIQLILRITLLSDIVSRFQL